MEQSGLKGILPDHVVSDPTLLGALELLTGFQSWRRLRQDQELSPEEAEAVLKRSVTALLMDVADKP